jgi:RNA polymerase sigma factor (sigma-70 family)
MTSDASRLSRIDTPWSILRRAHEGSDDTVQRARQSLLDRYGGAVRRYLGAVLRDQEAADEVFQEFALRLVRGDFRTADPERGRFRSFVKTALHNLIVDFRRKASRHAKFSLDDAAAVASEPAESPDDLFLKSWSQELLDRSWTHLREIERAGGAPYYAALRLLVDDPGWSSDEIASRVSSQLGRPFAAGNARVVIHRAADVRRPARDRGRRFAQSAAAEKLSRNWGAELASLLQECAGPAVSGYRSHRRRRGIALLMNQRTTHPRFTLRQASVPTLTRRGGARRRRRPARGRQRPAAARSVGDYELLEEIARGGMGVVYKARQKSLDRIVAVKMIRDSALASPEDVARFQSEAAAAARLQHPHIVAIHEVGQHAGRHFFSMDYIEGVSLASQARDNPFAPAAAATMVQTIACAVQAAHDQGILHRDLKPSNVLIDAHGQPHVTDFGLAKRLQGDSRLTGSEQILGTPAYMPPEQARGERGQVGFASDVYSLGAILYELLTGRPPFRGESPVATIRQVLESEPLSPRRLNPAVSRDLETICLRCLVKEPARRYTSAQALADDLRRLLVGEPIRARRITAIERSVKWARRRPTIAALLAAVLLLAVVGVSGILWQWRRAVAANDQLGQALAVKSRLLTETEAAKNQAEQSARTSQRAAEILTETFQGVDRLGLVTDFFLEGSQASTAEVRSLAVLNRAAARVHEFADEAPAKARLMDTLGIVFMSLGRMEEAASLLEGSLRIRSSQAATDDEALAEKLAETRTYLGTLRFVQGRHEEAAALAEAVLASGHVRLDEDVVALLLGMLRMETAESDDTIREVGRLVLAATDERRAWAPKGTGSGRCCWPTWQRSSVARNEHPESLVLALQAQESVRRVAGAIICTPSSASGLPA